MTIRTYELDPPNLVRAFAIVGSGGPNLLGSNAAKRLDDDGTISQIVAVGFGLNLAQVSFMRFDFGTTVAAPPPGSVVTDARIRLTPSAVEANPIGVSVAALADGRWNDMTLPSASERFGPGSTEGNDAQVTIRDPSSVVIEGPTFAGTTGFFEWPFKTNLIDGLERIGQTVLVNSNDTLGECAIRLRRTISRTATISISVYQARANDGSDDRPDEVLGVLATSNTRPHNDMSTAANGSEITFTFSGGNQIALSSGTRYVFVLESSWSGSGPLQAARVLTKGGNLYTDGSAQFASTFRQAFAEANYPEFGQLPFLFEADNSTARDAPHGSIVETTVPGMPTSADVEVLGLAEIVQEWLDTGTPGCIGITIHPTDIQPTDAFSKQWNDAELIVTYGTPVDMSSAVSIAWNASGLSQVVKLASAAASIVWNASGLSQVVKLASAAASIVWSSDLDAPTVISRVIGKVRGKAEAEVAVRGAAEARPSVRGKVETRPSVKGEGRVG